VGLVCPFAINLSTPASAIPENNKIKYHLCPIATSIKSFQRWAKWEEAIDGVDSVDDEIGIIQSDNEFFKIIFLGLLDISPGLGFFGGKDFVLLTSSTLLDLSLDLLESFTLGIPLSHNAESSETVDGLILHQVLLVIVGQAESRRSVSSEGSFESEQNDVLGLPVVLVSDQLSQVLLRYVGLSLVVHVKEQFLPCQ